MFFLVRHTYLVTTSVIFKCSVTYIAVVVSQSETGIETWKWHETRKAYWGSSNNEALLNLCSESVTAALSAAQCAWLKRGVSGMLLSPDFPRDQRCGEQLLRKLVADAMSCARSSGLETP